LRARVRPRSLNTAACHRTVTGSSGTTIATALQTT
jgi:hypothetical protein